MLFLGFSAGIPILLIFSTLGLWLNEANIDKHNITYFSWAALGYSFKFIWAPLVDKLEIPILNKLLGRRRSWMLVAQLAIIIAILLMANVDPLDNLTLLAYGAVLLGFSSATQDIVIDAYRIECADSKKQAMLSATYVAGYRIGMLIAGAGSLFLASYLGSSKNLYSLEAWQQTYMIMAFVMLIGVATTLIIDKEKTNINTKFNLTKMNYIKFFLLFIIVISIFISVFILTNDFNKAKLILTDIVVNKYLASFIIESVRLFSALIISFLVAKILIKINFIDNKILDETYINPIKDFFIRYGTKSAILLLIVIGFYRISDITLGVVANIFYQDIGFNKIEIATISKSFGLFMTITGSFLGGVLANKLGVFKVLFIGALLSSISNLLFIILAKIGYSLFMLYITIIMDNLAGGLAIAAFIAFLSNLTNVSFTAMQYAIFSSVMTLLPKIFAGYSGSLVANFGYSNFFIITTIIGLPVLYLLYKIRESIK